MLDTDAELYRGVQALACAVLERAIEDARESPSMDGERVASRCLRNTQARVFLTATSGAWAKSRAAWCDRAGIDPEAFQVRVQRMLRV